MPDLDTQIGYTEARVLIRATPAELLKTAKDRAPDPAIFEQYPPFVWASEISSDRLDSYYTRMDAATTLANYATDAAEGRAVLVGHDTRALPVGYSLTGTLEHAGDATRVLSDAYALTDPTSEQAINRLRAGIVRDISVGFSWKDAQCVCSICGRDMWRDYRCWHIPGLRYKRTDNPEDAVTDPGGELAWGLIKNAHLSEYSLVFDGATPGAAVLQAQRNAAAGRLTIELTRSIERQYRIHLPDKQISVPGIATKGNAVNDDELKRLLEAAAAPADLAADQRGAWLATRVAELAQLAPLAEDGRQYRTDLVNTAVAEAVRAFGAEAGEAKRDQLLRFDLDTIKAMTVSWREIGDAKLPGGRVTTDETPPESTKPAGRVRVPGLSRG